MAKKSGTIIQEAKSQIISGTTDILRTNTEFHNFRVNDIAFSIPPTQIEISHRNSTTYHSYLRSHIPPKEKSGKSVVHITVKWIVVPEEYWKVHRLTKMFKHTPFWEIENQYVRTAVIPTAASDINMAVCAENMSISNVEGFANCVSVELAFSWFNFRPFSQNFMFRKDWDFDLASPESSEIKRVTLFGIKPDAGTSSSTAKGRLGSSGTAPGLNDRTIPNSPGYEAGYNLFRKAEGPVVKFIHQTEFTEAMAPHLPTYADHADNSQPYIRYLNWLQAKNLEEFFGGAGLVDLVEGNTDPNSHAWTDPDRIEILAQAGGHERIRPLPYPYGAFEDIGAAMVEFNWYEFKPLPANEELANHLQASPTGTATLGQPTATAPTPAPAPVSVPAGDLTYGELVSKNPGKPTFKGVGTWTTIMGGYGDTALHSDKGTGRITRGVTSGHGYATDMVWESSTGLAPRCTGELRLDIKSPITGKILYTNKSGGGSSSAGGRVVIEGEDRDGFEHKGLVAAFWHVSVGSMLAEGSQVTAGITKIGVTGYGSSARTTKKGKGFRNVCSGGQSDAIAKKEEGSQNTGPHIHVELYELKEAHWGKAKKHMFTGGTASKKYFNRSGLTAASSKGWTRNIEGLQNLTTIRPGSPAERQANEPIQLPLNVAEARSYMAEEEKEGWHLYKSEHVAPVLFRERSLRIKSSQLTHSMTATGWALQFQNGFAHIPLDGHEYPTAHFTGGFDVRMSLSFVDNEQTLYPETSNAAGKVKRIAEGEQLSHTEVNRAERSGGLSRKAELFMEMRRILETNARAWRSIPDSWLLKITCIASNTAGCRTWIMNSLHTQSIPGSPGLYSIHAEFDAARPFAGFEELNQEGLADMKPVHVVYRSMFEKIKKYIGVFNNSGLGWEASDTRFNYGQVRTGAQMPLSSGTRATGTSPYVDLKRFRKAVRGQRIERPYQVYGHWEDTNALAGGGGLWQGQSIGPIFPTGLMNKPWGVRYSNQVMDQQQMPIQAPSNAAGIAINPPTSGLGGSLAGTGPAVLPVGTDQKWFAGVVQRIVRCLYLLSYVTSDKFFGGFSPDEFKQGTGALGVDLYGLEEFVLPDFEGAGYHLVDKTHSSWVPGTGNIFGTRTHPMYGQAGWYHKSKYNFWLDPYDEWMGTGDELPGAAGSARRGISFNARAMHRAFAENNDNLQELIRDITQPKWEFPAAGNYGNMPGMPRNTAYPRNTDLDITTPSQEQELLGHALRYINTNFAMIIDEAMNRQESIFKEEGEMLYEGTVGQRRSCYPDLDLPPHPILNDEIFTPPDFYFFSNSHDSKADDMTGQEEEWQSQLDYCVSNAWGTQHAWTAEDGKYKVQGKQGARRTADNQMAIKRIKTNDAQRREALYEGSMNRLVTGSTGQHPGSGFKTTSKGYGEGLETKKNYERITEKGHYPRLTKEVKDELEDWFEMERDFVDPDSGRMRPDVTSGSHDRTLLFNKVGDEDNLDHKFGEEAIISMAQEAARDLVDDRSFLMRRAFPTFRLEFKDERDSVAAWQTFSQFYNYTAVKRITLTRSRKIPADLAIIELSNVAGVLDGSLIGAIRDIDYAKARPGALNPAPARSNNASGSDITDQARDAEVESNRRKTHSFDSLVIREGIPVRLYLGYSNNPDHLEPVFTGVIAQVQWANNNDTVTITCQSYAVELHAIEKGVNNEKYEVRGWEWGPPGHGELRKIKSSMPGINVVVGKAWGSATTVMYNQTLSRSYRYADTYELLSTLLLCPEVQHFGKWTMGIETMSGEGATDPLKNRGNKKDARWETWHFSGWYFRNSFNNHLSKQTISTLHGGAGASRVKNWWFRHTDFVKRKWADVYNYPQDDNLYCPHPDQWIDYGWFDTGGTITKKEASYRLFHTTIWEVFQEMTLRHPGWIASPVPYFGNDSRGVVDRMTMFFGVPSQRYWGRPMPIGGTNRMKELRTDIANALGEIAGRSSTSRLPYGTTLVRLGKITQTSGGGGAGARVSGDNLLAWILEYQKGLSARYFPFRKYHMANSRTNIVSNDIIESTVGMWNAASVRYSTDGWGPGADHNDIFEEDQKWESRKTFDMKAHNLMSEHEVIMKPVHHYRNCHGKNMARRYAQSSVMKGLQEMYKGSLVLLGNARIKPYDAIIIADEYNDIGGPIHVEEVTHIFTPESGFLSIIIPDAVVVANETSSFPIMAGIMQWVMPKKMDYIISTTDYRKEHIASEWQDRDWTDRAHSRKVQITAEGLDNIKGNTIVDSLLNCYNFYTWLQSQICVNVVPLMKGSRPMIAGLPEDLDDTTWSNFKGKSKSLFEQARIGKIEASVDAHQLGWQAALAYNGDLSRKQSLWVQNQMRQTGASR